MKAFLLAAGHGTRLRPLTTATPKCLLPVRGQPLLGIWLDLCERHGIKEVLINTHSHRDSVKEYVRRKTGGPAACITEEETLLGSAGTLLENRTWAAPDAEFWTLYGDVLTNANLSGMLEFHREHKQLATIGVYEVSNPKECGIVTVDRLGIVREFAEKPENPASNLAFAGLMLASPAVFELIPRHTPADIGFHLLPKMIGHMAAYPITDYLIDIGTRERYQFAQHTWPGLNSGTKRGSVC
jgi:mannose-1-phosphate guanylyltransferase